MRRDEQMVDLHAELTSRFVAAFLDGLTLFVFLTFLAVAWDREIEVSAGQAIAAIVIAAYFVFFTASKLQATPGKALAAIKVTDLEGRPIGLQRSAIRFIASLVSLAPAGLGFILAAWTPRRQGLHDLIAGTIVVDAKAEPEAIKDRLAIPTSNVSRAGAITVLVVILLVAKVIVDFMGDIGPRVATSEMLAPMDNYKREIGTALLERRSMPAAPRPPHAKAIKVSPDGTIVIDVADNLFPGGRVTYTPTIGADRTVDWKCTTQGIEQKYLPSACRY